MAAALTHIDRRTNTTKLTSAFCHYANSSKNDKLLCNKSRVPVTVRVCYIRWLLKQATVVKPKPSSQLRHYRYRSWFVLSPLAQYSLETRAVVVHTATSSGTIASALRLGPSHTPRRPYTRRLIYLQLKQISPLYMARSEHTEPLTNVWGSSVLMNSLHPNGTHSPGTSFQNNIERPDNDR